MWFKNHIYIYIYIYKQDLALNNLQWSIFHKTKLTKSLTAITQEFVSNIEQVLEAASLKAAAIRPPNTHHEN